MNVFFIYSKKRYFGSRVRTATVMTAEGVGQEGMNGNIKMMPAKRVLKSEEHGLQ